MSENFDKNVEKSEPNDLTPEELGEANGGFFLFDRSYKIGDTVTLFCARCGNSTWKCVQENTFSTAFRCEKCKKYLKYHMASGFEGTDRYKEEGWPDSM